MQIITFNVNGLRAAIQKGFLDWLKTTHADIVCLQEVKYDACHTLNDVFAALGYEYSFWNPAQKKGYSGVGILSKNKPLAVTYGSGYEVSDAEGRVVCMETELFIIVNTYAPSGTSGEERQNFKTLWLSHFQTFITNLQQQTNKPLLICGDFNIAHQEIDIHNPKIKATGFLPEEREWLSGFLTCGFIDVFRQVHPETQHYSWWTYRAGARSKNLGWRIDYYFVSEVLKPKIRHIEMLTSIHFSDHCPVLLELDG